MAVRKPLCLIPARGGSKRLPRKNVVALGGRPLLAWTVDCALESGVFDAVWVSSEDAEILGVAAEWGARSLPRDPSLAGDTVPLPVLCRRDVPPLAGREGCTDLYLLLPTSPLRRPQTIRRAWEAFAASDAETLLSLTPAEHPPHWALTVRDDRVEPVFPEGYNSIRQDLPSAFYHDGGHLITRIGSLERTGQLVNAPCMPFVSPPDETVDVNEPRDLALAEYLLEQRKEESP